MNAAFEIQLISVLVAVSCALPGVFLVLRKMSMVSDSISHTVLLGIVLAFFVTGDLSSPLLIIGAAVTGVITVWFTELLHKTHLVSVDSATGIIFPLLFSVAVILISCRASNVHIDTDSVLLGELAFAPFERLFVRGADLGARLIYISATLLLLNLTLIALFFKELKLLTFDPQLAALLGFSPAVLHYGLMTLVSVTAVGAFEAVGSVLVVAFMVGPPAAAWLVTDDLKAMMLFSAAFAMLSAVFGYNLAAWFDVSIGGMIAVFIGFVFACALLFAPRRGFISVMRRRVFKRRELTKLALLMRLCTASDGGDIKHSRRITGVLLREQKITLSRGEFTVTQRGLDYIDAFLRDLR